MSTFESILFLNFVLNVSHFRRHHQFWDQKNFEDDEDFGFDSLAPKLSDQKKGGSWKKIPPKTKIEEEEKNPFWRRRDWERRSHFKGWPQHVGNPFKETYVTKEGRERRIQKWGFWFGARKKEERKKVHVSFLFHLFIETEKVKKN